MIATIREAAFGAVRRLWRKRQNEGWTQGRLATEMGKKNTSQVSRWLKGPGNWEFKTFAQFVRALDGEAEVQVFGLEEPLGPVINWGIPARGDA